MIGKIIVNVQLSGLNAKIKRVSDETGKSMAYLVKTAAIVYGQAAAKESKPEPGVSQKRLGKKSRFREIVKLSARKPPFWFHDKIRGGVWLCKTNKYKLGNRQIDLMKEDGKPWWDKYMRSRDIVRATKGIKWWNKKTGGWSIRGYFPGYTAERHLKIPHAGYGKLGWIHSANWLKGRDDKGSLGTGMINKRNRFYATATIHNKIKYASNVSSPGVLGRAKAAAMKMLDQKFLRRNIARAAG